MFWDVPIDPTVTQVLEQVLGEDYPLSTFSGIDLKPHSGTVQPLHPDDALVGVPRPHERPIGVTVMWVVTPFNDTTGGTRLLPGSHREPIDLLWSQDAARMDATVQPDMEPGTVLIFDHAIFHGASETRPTTGVSGCRSVPRWLDPAVHQLVPDDSRRGGARYPEKLQDLLGYKTYNGIGSADETEPCSYRESYSGKGRTRPKRLSLD